ncbi:MAG TPA: sugar ABC transporter substrate-binding protein [Firmicutes bacterium]|nr:sugar ABC transporter substrate-binding protein [Bacillota bacterium]
MRSSKAVGVGLFFTFLCVLCFSAYASETTTLIFLNPHRDPPYVAARQAAVNRFMEKHPGVTVEMITPTTNYTDALIRQVVSGRPADIVGTNIGYDTWQLVQKGLIRDVTQFAAKDKNFIEAFAPTIMEHGMFEGKLWGIPISIVASYFIWYNQDTFDQQGLPTLKNNWTHDDFLSISRKLVRDSDGDGDPDRFAYTYHSWYAWKPWFYNRGGQFTDASMKKQTITKPETISAFEWITRLEHEYNIVPNASQVKDRGRNAYTNGDVAMIQAGPFLIPIVESAIPNTKHGVVLEPAGPYGQKHMLTTHIGLISSQSKHPDLAWELLKELASYETLAELSTAFASPSPRLDVFRNVFMRAPIPNTINAAQWYDTLTGYFEVPLFAGNDVPLPDLNPVLNGLKPAKVYFTEIENSYQNILDTFWNAQ